MPAFVPLAQRFWYRVTPNDETGCWEWTGSRTNHGYGRVNINQRAVLAHRVAYELCVADIPESDAYHGTCILHKCDNRRCVNPAHLRLGSHAENIADMIEKGRARHPSPRPQGTCRSGRHPWIEENIYTVARKDGTGRVDRTCKRCAADRARKWYHRERAA